MKIACVLMMHDEPLVGGELYNFLNLVKTLGEKTEVEALLFTDKNYNKKWGIAIDRGLKWHSRDYFQYLDNFDHVIFSAPGSRTDRDEILYYENCWWEPKLEQLKTKFSVQIQCEDNIRIFPRRNLFWNHKNCSGIIEIEKGFADLVAADRPKDLSVFRIAPWDYLDLHSANHRAYWPEKKRLIVSTSMLAQRKRVLPLVKCTRALNEVDFSVRVGGVAYAWSSLGDLREYHGWEYFGEYEDSIQVERDAMFHYNGTSKGIRRVELCTVQAAIHGCCPILNADFAPIWANDENSIRVKLADVKTFEDEQTFVNRVVECSEIWHEMNDNFVKELRRQNPRSDIMEFLQWIS